MASLAGRQAWERIIQAAIAGSQPKASDFKIWAESQKGWQPTQTPNGLLKYREFLDSLEATIPICNSEILKTRASIHKGISFPDEVPQIILRLIGIFNHATFKLLAVYWRRKIFI